MTTDRVAVVLMAYGTPRTPAEIEPYYTDIRRGRPPTPEALADLTARYAAIGGVSPLAQLTEAQGAALQAALDDAEPGRFEVSLGLKHADPKVEATASRVADRWCNSGDRARTRTPLLVVLGRPVPRPHPPGRRRGRQGRPGGRHRELGDRTGLRRVPGRRPQHASCVHARAHRGSSPGVVHGAFAPAADHRCGRSRTQTSCVRQRKRSRHESGSPKATTGRSPGSPPDARPNPGSAPTSSR